MWFHDHVSCGLFELVDVPVVGSRSRDERAEPETDLTFSICAVAFWRFYDYEYEYGGVSDALTCLTVTCTPRALRPRPAELASGPVHGSGPGRGSSSSGVVARPRQHVTKHPYIASEAPFDSPCSLQYATPPRAHSHVIRPVPFLHNSGVSG